MSHCLLQEDDDATQIGEDMDEWMQVKLEIKPYGKHFPWPQVFFVAKFFNLINEINVFN